jgi:glycosyltransferase involved in cell wall biosynthesis
MSSQHESVIPVSVMIFTLNEEINLPQCLDSLKWCDDIIVVDSYSTDHTEAICRSAGARFFQHPFEGFGSQRNWALDNTNPRYKWVLILDADERVPFGLVTEIRGVVQSARESVAGYRLKRRFYMWGHWLRYSSLYPTWVVRLIHRDRVRYINRGHAETQEVRGEILRLENDLIDENLKGMEAWFERQNRYSSKDAEYELCQEDEFFRVYDLIRNDPLARRAALKRLARNFPGRPLLYFLYSYVWRLGFLDGSPGLMFCLMKALYQQMITIKKYDLRQQAMKSSIS